MSVVRERREFIKMLIKWQKDKNFVSECCELISLAIILK